MERTITIAELQNTGVNTWSVKDNSPRGIHTAYTSELKPGDKVVIDNYFTTIIEAQEQPEEPEAVAVDSLAEGLDLGDYADSLNDYRDSSAYIGDAISEIADNRTSIYYSDILDFIRENPESLADVVAEGLYCVDSQHPYDLYKHAQAAEYMTIERDIYDHLRDAVILCAVDFIRYDLERKTIPADLAEQLEAWADEADNNDRMNDIPDMIREYFADQEESEE